MFDSKWTRFPARPDTKVIFSVDLLLQDDETFLFHHPSSSTARFHLLYESHLRLDEQTSFESMNDVLFKVAGEVKRWDAIAN